MPQSEEAPERNVLMGGNTIEAIHSETPPLIEKQPKPLLNLVPGALALVDPERGSVREIPFGTDLPTAINAVADALGKPTGGGVNRECREGEMDYARFGGFALYFLKGRLAGWSLDSVKQGLATASGIGIGSTLSDVRDSLVVTVKETSLGLEFATKDGILGGLLTGPGPDGKVEVMWSGQVCQFR
ncbi:hypothetical protein [Sphingomonas koreensis]